MSVSVFAVMAAKIESPTRTVRAVEPSCVRRIVNSSPSTAVTRNTSAFVGTGISFAACTVALNGGAGNLAPCPAATASVNPESAGLGAEATVLYAKFLWASMAALGLRHHVRRVAAAGTRVLSGPDALRRSRGVAQGLLRRARWAQEIWPGHAQAELLGS
jgi:hypothetical protein